jgi:hypothetical protein
MISNFDQIKKQFISNLGEVDGLKRFLQFQHSLLRFAKRGFTTTSPEILAERAATCRACPEWDAAALNNTGRCRKCGCSTWAKLRMATERCPLGKWEAFDTTNK